MEDALDNKLSSTETGFYHASFLFCCFLFILAIIAVKHDFSSDF